METEDVVESVADATETETEATGPARDEQGRFASGADAPTSDEVATEAEPEVDEEGNPVAVEPTAPDPAAEAEQAVSDWKPFTVKLHGEEKPIDWLNHLDGDNGGVYVMPADVPKLHQMAGYAEAYQKSRTEITQQRRTVAELQRQLEARTQAPNEDVAAATVIVQKIQKLSALDPAELEQYNADPSLYMKLLIRDALDAAKDAKIKLFETARTETQSQWESEDTDQLQTENIHGWVYQLRNSVPELKALTDTQLNEFIEEVLPAKGAYFTKENGELKVRNDLLHKQLTNRAKLLTDAQTRASAANAARKQNEKVLNKSAAPPTVPAKGSATAAEATKKPKSREEWRQRVGVA